MKSQAQQKAPASEREPLEAKTPSGNNAAETMDVLKALEIGCTDSRFWDVFTD